MTTTLNLQETLQAAEVHIRAERLAEAEDILRSILAVDARQAEALHMLGVVAHMVGQNELAIQLISAAVAVRPDANFYTNLGIMYMKCYRLDESIEMQHKALALAPDLVTGHFNLGHVLEIKGKYSEAADCFRRVIELDPEYSSAYNNLGACLQLMHRLDEAVEYYKKALEIGPKTPGWYNNLAIAYRDQARIEESLEAHDRGIEIGPNDQMTAANKLRTLHFWDKYDPVDSSEQHKAWARKFAEPLYSKIVPPRNSPEPGRPLRIGYVSGDFRAHPVANFLEPLLANVDRSKFKTFCYANEVPEDALTPRFKHLADVYHDVSFVPDEKVAETIRGHGIDILVDMAGHTTSNRLLMFAYKAAPVQVTWLGYQDTTGMSTIDYRITDALCDPPGLTDPLYTEQLYRLPRIFACYASPLNAPPVGALPALSNGYVTFACLNNYGKSSDRVVSVWCEILKRVPNSRLRLFIGGGDRCNDMVKPRFAERGIDPARILLIGRQPYPLYRELFNQVDITFDPFPCSGHTTMCDSLFAGVPCVTLVGNSYVSRMGYSVLRNIGLSELIAENTEQYMQICVALAGDLPRLATLRQGLRQKLLVSPVGDQRAFALDMENAFRDMWHTWCAAQRK